MVAVGGYDLGYMPPNHCSPPFGVYNCPRGNSSTEPYIALHNMLLAHASAARLYKQKYKDEQNGSVGITCFINGMVPYTSSKEDEIATQRNKDFYIGWVLHPLYYGDYPDVMKKTVGNRLPSFSQEESDLVKNSSDFVGVIHYTTKYVTHSNKSNSGLGDYNSDMNALEIYIGNSTMVATDVLPWGLEEMLEYIKQNYGNPPVYILENGRSMYHYSSLNDVGRVEYLEAYIAAVLNSVRNGSNTRGYFQWSFIDLNEFINANYTFGLYHVNFSDPNRQRTPKTSALWYSAFLKGKTITSPGIKNLSLPSSSPGFSSQ